MKWALLLFALASGVGIDGLSWAAGPTFPEAPGAAGDPASGLEDPDELFRMGQDYLGNLGPYQPMYFLFGAPLSDSKFQLSFRYRFFNPAAPLSLRHPWVRGINFGYTQTSYWDLGSDSRPFGDTSYKPEIFYLSRSVSWRPRGVDALFVQAGIHHESNGRGEEASRSTNSVYVMPAALFIFENSGLGFGIAPRIKYYFDNSEHGNPDIEDYRGRFELVVGFGKADGLVLKSNLRPARRGTSVEVDATYPMSRSWFQNMQIYLHVQYTNALAESLLDYRERHESIRVGFAFYR